MKINLFLKIIFVILLALVVNIFIYFAFGSVYSAPLFNIDYFKEQYESGVYQYRFLSSYFLIKIYELLQSLPFSIRMKMDFWDKNTQPNMFLAYAILNTFFLAAGNVILLLITETRSFIAGQSEKLLIISTATFSIAISQFIVVPYDCSSYFFLFLFVFLFLKYIENQKVNYLVSFVFILMISTLNRESSALSLSFAAAMLYRKFGFKKEFLIPLLYLIIGFLIIYFSVRFFYGSFDVRNDNLFLGNITSTRSYFGILFWIVFGAFSLMICNDKKALKSIVIFHLLSLPYIIMCFYTGSLYEIRLYIPLFLTALIIGKIQINNGLINYSNKN